MKTWMTGAAALLLAVAAVIAASGYLIGNVPSAQAQDFGPVISLGENPLFSLSYTQTGTGTTVNAPSPHADQVQVITDVFVSVQSTNPAGCSGSVSVAFTHSALTQLLARPVVGVSGWDSNGNGGWGLEKSYGPANQHISFKSGVVVPAGQVLEVTTDYAVMNSNCAQTGTTVSWTVSGYYAAP